MSLMRVFLSWLLALSCSVSAATYEVANRNPQASDEGPGTTHRPWKNIAKAVEKLKPGDTLLIRGGIYRERVLVKLSGNEQAPIRLAAAPGEQVVLTGADQIASWKKSNPESQIYMTPWPHRFNTHSKTMTHPGDEYHRVIGRCEQIAVNGYLLRQVPSGSQLAPGSFFADVTNQVLCVWDSANRDLNQVLVEASVRQEILRVQGDFVQLSGLRFRYAANPAQRGAVVLAGRHNVMEDCRVERMNASGATFAGENAVVRRCVFRDNGQLGFGANRAHRLLFTDCLVENNNTKNFDRGWEAGGNKLVLCREAVLQRSRFVRNHGNGVWFDIGNEDCTVRQCLIAENDDSGIFYEISFNLRAHDNVIVGNGFAATGGAWGAQAGISVSSSPGCLIERNILLGNREGLNFREQARTTPTIDSRKERPVWNHDEVIRHNIIAFNRDAQVWGWFDVQDNRHWPADNSEKGPPSLEPTASQPADIAAAFQTTNHDSQPQDLALEKLRLQFLANCYFAAPGQGWFNWGVTWKRHKRYGCLNDYQSELGIDRGSQVMDPGFAHAHQMDFRLPKEVMAHLKESYPQGFIPGVVLGEKQ